jgi:hypothetical protein
MTFFHWVGALSFKEVEKCRLITLFDMTKRKVYGIQKLRDPQILSPQAKELRQFIIKEERKLRFFGWAS